MKQFRSEHAANEALDSRVKAYQQRFLAIEAAHKQRLNKQRRTINFWNALLTRVYFVLCALSILFVCFEIWRL